MNAISTVIERGAPVTAAERALIILHGRGGTARGMLEIASQLVGADTYIAAPQATNISWYPNRFMDEAQRNEPNLSATLAAISDLINQIAEHMPRERIFIAGFSQGACLSLEITARAAQKYGGIIAFTGGLMGRELDPTKYRGDFAGTNVFISNGDHDPFIPLVRSEQSKVLMETLQARVTLKVYKNRPHIVTEDEIKLAKNTVIR